MTVRFLILRKGEICKKIRLCRTSAKGEPAKSRWVPHLDASDFPIIRPCLSPRMTAPVYIMWIPQISRTPNTADLSFIILCEKGFVNGMRGVIFSCLILAGRERFPFQRASRNVYRVLPLPNGVYKPPQTRTPTQWHPFPIFRAPNSR